MKPITTGGIRNIRRFPMIAFSIVCSFTAAAAPSLGPLLPEQFSMPISSQPVEQDFVLTTAMKWTTPCVAIVTRDKEIDVIIARDLLERLAHFTQTNGEGAEADRLARLHAGRAQRLLDTIPSALEIHGCARAALDGQSQYLLARLLNSGQVTVFDARTQQAIPSIIGRASSMPNVAGSVSYRLQDTASKPRYFFTYLAWIR